MLQITLWSFGLWTLVSLPVGWTIAYGQETPSITNQVQVEFLEYRLRPGESLSEIARLFHLPVEELAQLNRIADPTRLQAGQFLKVPNVFARQAVQLRTERDRLVAEKAQLQKTLEGQQQRLVAVEAELNTVEAEKTALRQNLVTTLQWKRGTLALAVLLLGILAWGLKSKGERAQLARHLTVLAQENTALNVAKDKYRQAVAQLELRCQKLLKARDPVPTQFLTEGVTLLTRAFSEGAAHLEQLLASITAECEHEEQILSAEQKTIDAIFHPLRGFLQRHRFKYHAARS